MTDLLNNLNHYSGKLRVRICGICRQNDAILLIRHKPFAHNTEGFWSPPGGGLEYGESMRDCLVREFKEETGLDVEAGRLMFLNELLQLPLHALELFFEVTITGGFLHIGSDPELHPENQLIAETCFKSLPEIKQIPSQQVHQIFHRLQSLDDLDQFTSL